MITFFESGKKCQWDCFNSLMTEVLVTLVCANGANGVMASDGKHQLVLALTGAMRACYPMAASRDQVKDAVTVMVKGMGDNSRGTPPDETKMAPCDVIKSVSA